MTACVLFLALMVESVPLRDQPDWKRYQASIEKATTYRVRWEQQMGKEDAWHVGKTGNWRLYWAKPDKVMLEQEGVLRRVWDGNSGIDLDLRKKTYLRTTAVPGFKPAFFLGLPGFPTHVDSIEALNVEQRLRRLGSDDCAMLRYQVWGMSHVPTYIWWLSRDSGRIVQFYRVSSYYMEGWVGDYTNRIIEFETGVKLPESAYSTEPPVGFKPGEKTQAFG
jgi:hypothetical protein